MTDLLTPRFLLMCGFSFTVFLSAFQLLPTAPFRVLALGGTEVAAGLFLAFLTYSSALTAPFTGAIGDRLGRRTMLIGCSAATFVFSLLYGLADSYHVLLALVLLHGVFWSGLLSASGAYALSLIPEDRRAEGIGYWGLASVAAIAVAPTIGLWIYGFGWMWVCVSCAGLNAVMAIIAARLPADVPRPVEPGTRLITAQSLEWRVFIASLTLFLVAFGYGGITSFVALYAGARGIEPRGIFFVAFAGTILVTRPFSGRLADQIGSKQVLLPSIVLAVIGMAMLAFTATRGMMIASAIVFGFGFGSMYPAFAAHVMKFVTPERHGAAFGGLLAALDTGIGTGSMAVGSLIHQFGYRTAFVISAMIAALALPYFLAADARLRR